MSKSSLNPKQFANVASIEQLARSILADASFIWQTELWLDPIEKAKLAGEKLTRDQERVVARELVKTSARVDDMLASAIDLYQMYDDAGAAKADYDTARKMLLGRKPLSFSEVWREAEPHLPGILAERGFSKDLYESLMAAAREIGMSFDGAEFTADKEGIALLGKDPHRLLRDPVQTFPPVDGNTFVREGLLQTYNFVAKKEGEICTTDSYQALLALAKYSSEQYRARAREAMSSGLQPYKTGVAWFIVVLIIVIIAIVAAIVVGILCAAKVIGTQACNITLTVLGAIITIGVCILAGSGTENSFSCGVSSGGSDG